MRMRNRWNNLAPRERWFVLIGGIGGGLLLLYIAIISPFSNALQSSRQRIVEDSALLQWMQRTSQQIEQLRASGTSAQGATNQSLLVVINQSAEENQLKNYITQISQTQNQQVTVRFDTVPFDNLVIWLEKLWKQYSIEVSEISVIPKETAGTVEVTMTLQSSKGTGK